MSLSESAGAVLWSIVILGQWVHSQFLQPLGRLLDSLLSAWEESVRSVIREWFAVVTHAINTASGAVLSIFSGSSYFHTVKKTSSSQQAKSGAWHTYWQQATGTFNALLEREGLSSLPRALSRASSAGSESFLAQPTAGATSAGSQQQQASSGRSTLPGRLKSWWRSRRSSPPEAQGVQGRGPVEQGRGAGKKAVQGRKQNKGAGVSAAAAKGAPAHMGGRSASAVLRGSELFELPSGFAVSEGSQHRGLVEDARVAAEVGVTRAFGAVRRGLRKAMWLDGSSKLPADLLASRMESRRVPLPGDTHTTTTTPWEAAPAGGVAHAQQAQQHLPSLTSHSMEDLNVWTASDIILRSGYPLEEHSVTAPDGYVLQMHRIPRHGARDVVFFQHGVLDTSLGWVANGSVGSQAFAAYDAGFDVWLANSRSNAPRLHQDPKRRGSRYWHYSSNELGLVDIAAQVDHLHGVKVREILVQQRGGMGSNAVAHSQEPAAAEVAVEEEGAAAQQAAQQGAEVDFMARLRRSASAPAMGSGWEECDAQVEAAGDGATVATAAAAATSSFAAALVAALSGVGGHIADAQAPAATTASGAGPVPQHAEESTWVRERQIGAAAAAAGGSLGAAGEPAGAAPQVAMPAGAVLGAGQCAPLVRGVGYRGPGEEGLTFLRRTQSAGAILAAEPLAHATRSSRQSRRNRARTAVAAGSEEAEDEGGLPGESPVPRRAAAGTDWPAGTEAVGTSAACEGLPVTGAPASEALAAASHSAWGAQGSGAQGSEASQLWESGLSSSDEGYATPRSTGWDTPRSGYATPGSERSMGSSRGIEADVTPYRLQAVGHSLGAASLLIYAVGCRMMGRPHRFRRIVLMSPAGFHTHVPMALRPFKYLMPAAVRILRAVRPGVGAGLRLPSPLLRYITFKLSMDLHHIPALHELVRAGARLLLSGDRSQWDRAVQMPHYNTYSMPALSLHCGAHFAQWSRDPHFRLFDYGTAAANRQHYGSDVPPSIADHYYLLAPVPVDLVAGRYDGIISCQDVYLHYLHMKEAGVHVTYRDYDFGHMDFTFAVKDELRHYVLSRLQRPIL